MSVLDFFFERPRSFAGHEAVKGDIAQRHHESAEHLAGAEILLIYAGIERQTWILATPGALYCVIDNLKEPAPRTRWRIPRDEILRDGNIVLPIRTYSKSQTNGYIEIDAKRKRLFTRRLFADIPVEERVKNLILTAFQGGRDRSGDAAIPIA